MNNLMKLPHLTIVASCFLALAAGGSLAQDQDNEDDLDPVSFTAAQAIGGGLTYQRSCASCHGSELEGFSAPPLVGEGFSHWFEQPVADLHDYIKHQMPADAPGSLSDAQVSTIIAFIAQANGMKPGSEAIPTDPAELESVKIDTGEPGEDD